MKPNLRKTISSLLHIGSSHKSFIVFVSIRYARQEVLSNSVFSDLDPQ